MNWKIILTKICKRKPPLGNKHLGVVGFYDVLFLPCALAFTIALTPS